MPSKSFVHPQPKDLPTIDGPFTTASSRAGAGAGGTSVVVTTRDELNSVLIDSLYSTNALHPSSNSPTPKFSYNQDINKRVALWRGDITTLQVDALVNAANRKLLGGGGVDGAIHRAAGPELAYECSRILVKAVRGTKANPYDVRIEAGEGVLTAGYDLPAKYVIHTGGPDLRKPLRPGNLAASDAQHTHNLLQSYQNSLQIAMDKKLESIAFSAISVGVFAFPLETGTRIALNTVRTFLATNSDLALVVFTVFDQKTVDAYASLIPEYFPPPPSTSTSPSPSSLSPSSTVPVESTSTIPPPSIA